ncbi:MAG: phosphoribosylanthranilate isomerase [Candidatus Weimeria sp.]
MTKIKICGLRRKEDIEIVNRYHPDFVGFIIDFPKSHRSITGEEVRKLTENLDSTIKKVGVFVNQPAEKVIGLLESGVIDIAQLHGNESEEYIREVQSKSGKEVIKAFEIHSEADFKNALLSSADYLLLDQGKGGGRTFDWSLIRERPDKRWFLAGGLNTENLRAAIGTVHPWAVDISSGVETDGCKDENKIRTIMKIVR